MSKYERYLKRENAQLPEIHQEILKKGEEIPTEGVLKFSEKDKLLEEGYLPFENGFHHFPDGSVYVACLTKMPKVNIEMLYWWFQWHAEEGIRYRIWYPEKHFDVYTDSTGLIHYVTEDVGIGKQKLIIKFLIPAEFGFDLNKLEKVDFEKVAMICAKVGIKRAWFTVWHTKMCHMARKVDDGIELRSRFWIGERIEAEGFLGKILTKLLNKPLVKRRIIPKGIGKHMFHHCAQEYHNLAEILPEIYEEEHKDK
ncbi:MAG: hypothetical protein NZ879_07790 [Archaeoglobaceae archaeon]|nr:hypothetical protein [Archaeoglobaceae archaeon]MDW8118867.1 hypothetical protein [Archaeoglobaceae archaeon]